MLPLHQGLELSSRVIEGLECLGVLEAAGQVCLLHLMVSLTVALVITHGDLALATPATTLTQLFPQAKGQAPTKPLDLGMSAGSIA